MNRPYIVCHMLTSLDGKIAGPYLESANGLAGGNVFYNLAFGSNRHYQHQGWLSGRITTDDNFTFYEKPELDEQAPLVPSGDHIVPSSLGMYYVSIDPSGKLGWKSNQVVYDDTHAHVIEVLTEQTPNSYKAFLRKLNISYVIAGDDQLNYEVLLHHLTPPPHPPPPPPAPQRPARDRPDPSPNRPQRPTRTNKPCLTYHWL